MIINSSVQATLDSGDFHFEFLLWVKAKNRTTGVLEASGIHTGEGELTVSIDGVSRTYQGAGQLIDIPSFTNKIGLEIEENDFTLAILSPEITNMIRAYDADLAPADLHLAIFNKDMALVGITQVVKGFVNGIVINEDAEEATCTITVTSNIQEAVRGLTLKKSHESQKLIDSTDEGFKYAAVAGTTETKWGTGEGRRVRSMRVSSITSGFR